MNNLSTKTKNLIIAFIMLAVSVFAVTASWATLAFVDSQDSYSQTAKSMEKEQLEDSAKKSKTRAPEPTTMVLFGSGFLGMVMSFIRKTYARVKRLFDLVFAIVVSIVLSPVMLLTALLVKVTSKGPVIYSQTRVGKNGKLFEIYKFRSMTADAEAKSGAVWAAKNDSRITPIGHFLRKSRLDELPQFLNIIKGEMSLIGPRPERPVFVDQFKKEISDYEKRLEIKPGITGLAQVWHRYDENIRDVRKKIKYDLLYIKKVCLWTDFRILLRTVRVVLTGKGAR